METNTYKQFFAYCVTINIVNTLGILKCQVENGNKWKLQLLKNSSICPFNMLPPASTIEPDAIFMLVPLFNNLTFDSHYAKRFEITATIIEIILIIVSFYLTKGNLYYFINQ
jgi:hypothetical protein